jgi:hypothetical protein
LLGAVFCRAAALRENRAEARAYERAVREYAEDRCEIDLWDALYRLGYMPDQIQLHVDQPRRRASRALRPRAAGRYSGQSGSPSRRAVPTC